MPRSREGVKRFGDHGVIAADRTTSIRPSPGKGAPLSFVYRGPGQSERVAAGPIATHVTTGTTPGCRRLVGPVDPFRFEGCVRDDR